MHSKTELKFPLTLNGMTFENLVALAKSGGVKYPAAYKRMKRGYSADQILSGKIKTVVDEPLRPKKICGKPVLIGDVTYGNLHLAHEALQPKASLNTVMARLRQGWTHAQAFEVEPKIDGRRIRKASLKPSNSGAVPARTAGGPMGDESASQRLPNSGKNKTCAAEQAVSEKLTAQNPQPNRVVCHRLLEVDGVRYGSVTKLARAYDRDPSLVFNRISVYRWAAERAVKEDPKDAVEVDGVRYASVHAAWTKLSELKYSTFCARRRRGLPLNISLGLEALPKKIRIRFEEKEYATRKELAADFGLTAAALSKRLRKMDLKDALEFVAPPNGLYSLAYFAKYPDVAARAGRLYFVRLETQDGPLHKIGITLNSVHKRLQRKFELVAEFHGRLADLFQIEQQIIVRFAANHKRADEKFEGKTETFSLTAEMESVVVQAIRKLHAQKMN